MLLTDLNSTVVTTEEGGEVTVVPKMNNLNSTVVTTEAAPSLPALTRLPSLNSTVVTTEANTIKLNQWVKAKFKFYCSNN